MLNYLDLYKDKKIIHPQIDKVLCIVEGKTELSFIKKVYELTTGSEVLCENFVDTIIKLSWGKQLTKWNDKSECNFQGGNQRGCITPYPVLESLNNENIELYKSILVIFDRDLDCDDVVAKQSRAKLCEKDFLFVSDPCFESESIAFFINSDIEEFIKNEYRIIDNSKCSWYKKNFSQLPKNKLDGNKKIFKRSNSADSLIKDLRLSHLNTVSDPLFSLIQYVKATI